jgi:predicted TIM-barrel fold metal-dependent hydrolase
MRMKPMTVIDSDAHVVETPRTWEHVEEAAFRPRVVVEQDGGSPPPQYWLIDGRAFPKDANIGRDTPDAAREMSDIAARLAHMDELGVDVHVLYPTLFLRPVTRRPEADLALCQGYNRWLAEIWRKGKGRLRWAVVPPLMSMDKALEELHWAKERGACAVFMRGLEGDRRLSSPYFFPLYEQASKLNLPICIHSGTGNFATFDLYAGESGFSNFKLTGAGAFHDLLMQGVPERFPELRWGFVELSSQWVPYAMNDMELRQRRRGRRWPESELLRENRVYVACQTTDDLSYVLQYAGEDNIVIGTDYGHNDTSSELIALRKLREDRKVSPAVVDKFLGENAKRLYGL